MKAHKRLMCLAQIFFKLYNFDKITHYKPTVWTLTKIPYLNT